MLKIRILKLRLKVKVKIKIIIAIFLTSHKSKCSLNKKVLVEVF